MSSSALKLARALEGGSRRWADGGGCAEAAEGSAVGVLGGAGVGAVALGGELSDGAGGGVGGVAQVESIIVSRKSEPAPV